MYRDDTWVQLAQSTVGRWQCGIEIAPYRFPPPGDRQVLIDSSKSRSRTSIEGTEHAEKHYLH